MYKTCVENFATKLCLETDLNKRDLNKDTHQILDEKI